MIKAIQDRIVVKEIVTGDKTKSGIILSGTNEKSTMGEVLSVGPGIHDTKNKFIVPSVAEGDKIIFVQGAGESVEVEKQKFLILRETDIIAIVG